MSGLLGALADPQFRADVGQGLLGALNRGAVGGLLGGPVDIATMAMRPLGYRVEKPVGGSEWIGDQMERMGIVGPQRNAVAETLASVAVPAAMAKAALAVFAAEQAIPKAIEKYGMVAERAIAPAVTRGLERGGMPREMLLSMGSNTRSSLTESERASNMAQMGLERGWYRGGPQIVDGKRSGPWYTRDADEAAKYAERFGKSSDVREYAIPKNGFLDAGLSYSHKLPNDLAGILESPYYGKQGSQLAKEFRTFGDGERISGASVWQALESRFGNDGAAEVLSKLGAFKGVKGITGGPEAYVFKSAPVRDANKAAFDISRIAQDDIYGFATPEMLGALAAGSAGLGSLLASPGGR